MTKVQVAALFEEYPHVLVMWTIGNDYYFQHPDPNGIIIGVKEWTLADTV